MEKSIVTTVNIQPCKFILTTEKGPKTTYGYRCFTDFLRTYNNSWRKEDLHRPSAEILTKVVNDGNETNNDNVLKRLANLMEEYNASVRVGNDVFESAEVGYLLKGHTAG